ncbi:MAG TPA: hypothetical protein VFR14_07780 [Candidatus Limnocylindrales bacterium]|nr:hypothetical protein [Candidatus Limnocylindrales bacterium]
MTVHATMAATGREPAEPAPTDAPVDPGAERARLAEAKAGTARWYRFGPYLSDRQWGTVREDYSEGGTAWDYFPHDHARSRAYRWGEDGLLGISDDQARLCFAVALWNGEDPILKERLFGLTGSEGNHGEDVKEQYWFLDALPSHAYLKALYRYPQRAFPYDQLVDENRRRGKGDPEFELRDSGVFDEDRYFDVLVEYAKADAEDIVVRLSVTNHGPEAAPLHLLPTLWFRNTWSWGRNPDRPAITAAGSVAGGRTVIAEHPRLGRYRLVAQGSPSLLFTDNETNLERLYGVPNATPYVKDGIGEAVVNGRAEAVNADRTGTKAAAWYRLTVAPGATETILLRLSKDEQRTPFEGAEALFDRRIAEADAFYASLGRDGLTDDEALVQRQAFAGMIWSKQFYHLDVGQWLDGDPAQPTPPPSRRKGRNHEWRELNNADVISMPDAWEYPWYAAWDLAFHCLPLALVDPEFAKNQLLLLTREWYMHPNGQLPAYEWAFSDVNPPVHAWATWRVYKIDRRISGTADRAFLERVFHKLLLNFTWWVNRKDADGHNVFQGGFLGLDNIGVFDRSAPLPVPGHLGQADGTAWMGFYSLQMLQIALELAREDPVYEDIATKFFEHFLFIAGALNGLDTDGPPLWDEADEFFYDVLHLESGEFIPLKVRSLVGLMPLLAVETLEPELLERMPAFRRRLGWFLRNRPELAALVASWEEPGVGERRLLALVHGHRMKALLRRMLDESEFLSPHGIRALSRVHRDQPYMLQLGGQEHRVEYEPAESRSGLFGGNSNWRGPIWFPINYLLIEALQKFDHYYGPDFRVELPAGSGTLATIGDVAAELSRRLESIFLVGADGRRPVFGTDEAVQRDSRWRDHVLFYEYFDGDTGRGVGASHQTGWTGLVAKLLEQTGRGRAAS